MELVAENLTPVRAGKCPNCGAVYDEYNLDHTGLEEDNVVYRSYTCPGCGCEIEEVYKYSHVNAWKVKG